MDNFLIFTNFLLAKNYKLVNEDKNIGVVIYESEGLFIRIEQDRTLERFISLSRTNNHSWKGWYDMDIVRFQILNIPYASGDIYKFEQLSQFFINYYDEIMKAFSLPYFSNTEIALANLKNKRSKALFGY